jgi:hypothetical protein
VVYTVQKAAFHPRQLLEACSTGWGHVLGHALRTAATCVCHTQGWPETTGPGLSPCSVDLLAVAGDRPRGSHSHSLSGQPAIRQGGFSQTLVVLVIRNVISCLSPGIACFLKRWYPSRQRLSAILAKWMHAVSSTDLREDTFQLTDLKPYAGSGGLTFQPYEKTAASRVWCLISM